MIFVKSAEDYWYGAETTNYIDLNGKPTNQYGIYHGLPIRESDEVGWLQNPKKSIPRSQLERIIKELAKIKGIDVTGENKDTGYLEFGWSTNKNRGVADEEMSKMINSILYK